MARQSSIFGGNSGIGQIPLRHEEWLYSNAQMASGLLQKYGNCLRGYLNNGDYIALPAAGGTVVAADNTDSTLWVTGLAELDGLTYAGFWLNDAADKFYIITSDATNFYIAYVVLDGTVTKVGSVAHGKTGMDWMTLPRTMGSVAVQPIQGTTTCMVLLQTISQTTGELLVIDYETPAIVTDWAEIIGVVPAALGPDKNGYLVVPHYSTNFVQTTIRKVLPTVSGTYYSTVLEQFQGYYNYADNLKQVYMAGEYWATAYGTSGQTEGFAMSPFKVTAMEGLTNTNAAILEMWGVPAAAPTTVFSAPAAITTDILENE